LGIHRVVGIHLGKEVEEDIIMKLRFLRLLVVMLVLCIAVPAYANNQIRTLKVLILTDNSFSMSRIEQSVSNASDILDDQVLIRLEIVDVKKCRFDKRKGKRIMRQVKRKARRYRGEYDIAIAYIRLKNGRKFMGKCGGRYILVRSTMRGSGIVTAHEVGHTFVGSRHDAIGLMSAKVPKKKDTKIMLSTAFRMKRNRWKQFN